MSALVSKERILFSVRDAERLRGETLGLLPGGLTVIGV